MLIRPTFKRTRPPTARSGGGFFTKFHRILRSNLIVRDFRPARRVNPEGEEAVTERRTGRPAHWRLRSADASVSSDLMHPVSFRLFPLLLLLTLPAAMARAAPPCPGNPDALGTERVIAVDVRETPRVGRKHFPQTLPLRPKELVLTFDDGPEPGSTPRVLAALKHECVKASFFLLGRSAAAHPDLARRELDDGHTVAHHSFAHPLLNRMSVPAAEAEINRGFAAVDTALYGKAAAAPTTPFFRFPGFASSPAVLERLERRGIVVFGADLWASDWNKMAPDQEFNLVLQRIEATRGGIVLFHDTKQQTAAMLPGLLRALKMRGYQVVHVVPPPRPPKSAQGLSEQALSE
jgi:peptidoglycan-N-acetylglucosamine deacetylase